MLLPSVGVKQRNDSKARIHFEVGHFYTNTNVMPPNANCRGHYPFNVLGYLCLQEGVLASATHSHGKRCGPKWSPSIPLILLTQVRLFSWNSSEMPFRLRRLKEPSTFKKAVPMDWTKTQMVYVRGESSCATLPTQALQTSEMTSLLQLSSTPLR